MAMADLCDLFSFCVTPPPPVMSFPLDSVDIGFRNQVDDIRSFLDSRHPDHYTVYNLSPKSYRTAKFHSRVRKFSPGTSRGRPDRVLCLLRTRPRAFALRRAKLKNSTLWTLIYKIFPRLLWDILKISLGWGCLQDGLSVNEMYLIWDVNQLWLVAQL